MITITELITGFFTVTFFGVIFFFYAKIKNKKRLEEAERLKAEKEAFDVFKKQVEEHGLESVDAPNFVFGPNEVCYFCKEVKFRKILKTKYELYTGTLYLTNKQIVFTSPLLKVSKEIKDIAYIDNDGVKKGSLKVQIGKTWYEIIVDKDEIFEFILKEVINQNKSENPKYTKKILCEYCNSLNYIEGKSKQIKCSNCGGPLDHKKM